MKAQARGLVLPAGPAQLAHRGLLGQWRVPLKPQPPEDYSVLEVGLYHPTLVDRHGEEYPGAERFGAWTLDGECGWPCPFVPGASLYVREPLQIFGKRPATAQYVGGLTGVVGRHSPHGAHTNGSALWWAKRNSLSAAAMPKWASRTLLELESVEVQRVQEISHDEAKAGYLPNGEFALRDQRLTVHQIAFSHLWDSINKKRGLGWDSNPYVWVLGLKRVEAEAAA